MKKKNNENHSSDCWRNGFVQGTMIEHYSVTKSILLKEDGWINMKISYQLLPVVTTTGQFTVFIMYSK